MGRCDWRPVKVLVGGLRDEQPNTDMRPAII
jgi:hypothetical protein